MLSPSKHEGRNHGRPRIREFLFTMSKSVPPSPRSRGGSAGLPAAALAKAGGKEQI